MVHCCGSPASWCPMGIFLLLCCHCPLEIPRLSVFVRESYFLLNSLLFPCSFSDARRSLGGSGGVPVLLSTSARASPKERKNTDKPREGWEDGEQAAAREEQKEKAARSR